MVELVGSKVQLRQAGGEWTGRCPFHQERTPSFTVDAERKLFYCFGCQAKGNLFNFVEQTEDVGFRDAAEALARRYGVELKEEDDDPRAGQRRIQKQRLLALLEKSASYYSKFLWTSQEASRAREYLKERGLRGEVLRRFRVGYASSAWDRLLLGAQRQGFSASDLLAAGLAQQSGQLHDRFRARIMFPLVDARGRTRGFGARALQEDQKPKYLNSSESELFHKSRQLFGIDLARADAARLGRIVVVEGYTDVLALHQAGITESVAIMGTALTADQMAELSRAAPLVVLALDADRAGREAMLRAAHMAHGRGTELRAVEIPEGSDPAALLVSEGREAFTERLQDASVMAKYQLRRLLADADLSTSIGRDKVLDEARGFIATAPSLKQELAQEVAEQLGISPTYV